MSSHMTRRAVKQAKSHPSDSGNESDDQNDTERQSLYTNEEISSAQTLVSLMDNENSGQNAESSDGGTSVLSGESQPIDNPFITAAKSRFASLAAPVKPFQSLFGPQPNPKPFQSLFGLRPQTSQLPTSRQSAMFSPAIASASHSSQFPTHNQLPTAGQQSMFASQSMFSYPSASTSSAYPYGHNSMVGSTQMVSNYPPAISGTPGFGYYPMDPSMGYGSYYPTYGPYAGHSGYGPMAAMPPIQPMAANKDCHQCPYCLASSAVIQPKNN